MVTLIRTARAAGGGLAIVAIVLCTVALAARAGVFVARQWPDQSRAVLGLVAPAPDSCLSAIQPGRPMPENCPSE